MIGIDTGMGMGVDIDMDIEIARYRYLHCGPGSPTMAVHQSSSQSVHEIGCLSLSSLKARILKK